MPSKRSSAPAGDGSASAAVEPDELVQRALDHQAPTVEPDTPNVAQAAAGSLFGAVSALRQSRSLHPDGIVFEATFTVPRAPLPRLGAPLFDEPRSRPAVVRVSRSLGLPPPLPDLLGFTVRFVDVHGPGRHQDFPMISSGNGALLHHLMLPGRSFFTYPYSSVLLYRIGGDLRLVGALPATPRPAGGTDFDQVLRTVDRGDARFQMALARPRGKWEPAGELTLERRVPQEAAERVRFNPWNTGGGIQPAGPFLGLRAGAYRGSQAGWNAEQD